MKRVLVLLILVQIVGVIPFAHSGSDSKPPSQGSIPEELASRLNGLTLAEVVDMALENNPVTRATWNDAKAAAARHGMEKADLWPSVSADGSAQRAKLASTPDRLTSPQNTWTTSASLSWLLYDFEGRSGAIARTRLLSTASEQIHESTVQDVILQVVSAYFRYMSMKALRDAEQINASEAVTNLDAARQRHRVGLATIADVLQAEAAESRARLSLQRIEGEMQITRGALALSMGLPANIPYDIEAFPAEIDSEQTLLEVDQYIDQALRDRPDLNAAKARAGASVQNIREIRAKGLPSLKLTGTMGRVNYPDYDSPGDHFADFYSGGLSLHVPLFTGFASRYETRQAERQADAESARTEQLEQKVIFQVFSAYYSLKTASQQVLTSRDLLVSASKSEEVALARYREGVGSIIDLLSAQSVLADARSLDIQARWSWYTALAQLVHDTGSMNAAFGNHIVSGLDLTHETRPNETTEEIQE